MSDSFLDDLQFGSVFTDANESRVLCADFIDSGSYDYYCDGEKMPVNETWTRYKLNNSQRLIRSQRSSPQQATKLWVQSLEDGRGIVNFKIQWQQAFDDKKVLSELNCVVAKKTIQVQRFCNHREIQRLVMNLPKLGVILPLTQIYVGDALMAFQRQGGKGCVVSPWIENPKHAHRFLEVQLSDGHAKPLGRETLQVQNSTADKIDIDCQTYSYLGDQFDASARFSIDINQLLRRYSWMQGDNHWQVEGIFI